MVRRKKVFNVTTVRKKRDAKVAAIWLTFALIVALLLVASYVIAHIN